MRVVFVASLAAGLGCGAGARSESQPDGRFETDSSADADPHGDPDSGASPGTTTGADSGSDSGADSDSDGFPGTDSGAPSGPADACTQAAENQLSVGCEYYAVDLAAWEVDACFAAFVANTAETSAHLEVDHRDQALPIEAFARIPVGQGAELDYLPYDADEGLPAGEVAILFLSGSTDAETPCPIPAAVDGDAGTGMGNDGSQIGDAFRITADVPVVAYQVNPFGAGEAATAGASLLLPASVWDGSYVGVAAWSHAAPPSMAVIAMEDATEVTLHPVVDFEGGPEIPASAAGQPVSFTLDANAYAELAQMAELTGSVLTADKPIGLIAGNPCMNVPEWNGACDHGEQMIPPINALGHEYVGVMHRPRQGEPAIWRLVGAADDTQLSWSVDVGGPASLDRGETVQIVTAEPFVVASQDADHPFILLTYMGGAGWEMLDDQSGYGDPDVVLSVPTGQFIDHAVFFTDPTYPETNLVFVRKPPFHDVELDCAGTLQGWQPVGDFEWTRVDLSRGDFEGVDGCANGRHEVHSDGDFGLWVWGWGTPQTNPSTAYVSYGYPAGMRVQPLNDLLPEG